MNTNVVDLQPAAPGVAVITMQDRQNKNTFSPEIIAGLLEKFRIAGSDANIRAIVLTGYDTYFCSGGTQEGLLGLSRGVGKFTDTNIYSTPMDCEIPVLSAMQGHGIGGGFVFGMFADIAVLSRESVYTANFMKYGFTPGMGATYILPKKLGIGLAEEMLFSARTYRGQDLEKRGINSAVLPRAEVLPYTIELAREIADNPRISLVTLKRHLMAEMRASLPAFIEREVTMHDKTFHLPEVRDRIETDFGR